MKARSLRKLLLLHETAFVVLVTVTGALSGLWAYLWQQSSTESVRINALLHQAQQLRGDLYRELKEVTRARLIDDPTALDRYWSHLYHIDRGFNRLQQNTRNAPEAELVKAMRVAYELMQTEMNKLFAESVASSAALHIEMLDPAYEQWVLGDFETALQNFSRLIAQRQQALEEDLARWTRLAPILIPLPVLLAAGLLLFSHRSLQRGFVKPMGSVAAGALEMSKGNLAIEIPEQGTTEVVQLARSINEMARDLAASRSALVESERQAALGALVPVVAHNIRNPLASIRAAVQVADVDNPEEQREAGQAIIDTVDRLERWVSALLSYLHPMQPRRSQARLSRLVDNALNLLSPRLEAKSLRLERHDWALDDAIRVDVDLLEQALYGLLNNAVEASPPGAVITVTLTRTPATLGVMIDDQGPGMPEDVHPTTESPGPTTKQLGTGLGIPFALKVVQGHGGQVDFDAAPSGGARVSLTLPLTP